MDEATAIKALVKKDEEISEAFLSQIRNPDRFFLTTANNLVGEAIALLDTVSQFIFSDVEALAKLHLLITKFALRDNNDMFTSDTEQEARRRSVVFLRKLFVTNKAPIADAVAPRSVWTELRAGAKPNKRPSIHFSAKTAIMICLQYIRSDAVKAILSQYDPSAYIVSPNVSFAAQAIINALDERQVNKSVIPSVYLRMQPRHFRKVYLFLCYLRQETQDENKFGLITQMITTIERNLRQQTKIFVYQYGQKYVDLLFRRFVPALVITVQTKHTFYDKFSQERDGTNYDKYLTLAYQQRDPVFCDFLWHKIRMTIGDTLVNVRNDLFVILRQYDNILVSPLLQALDFLDQQMIDVANEMERDPDKDYTWYATTLQDLANSADRLRQLDTHIYLWGRVYAPDAGGNWVQLQITQDIIRTVIADAENAIDYLHKLTYQRSHL